MLEKRRLFNFIDVKEFSLLLLFVFIADMSALGFMYFCGNDYSKQTAVVLVLINVMFFMTYFLMRILDRKSGFIDLWIKYRYLWCFIFFICLTFMGVHGFSVSVLSGYMPYKTLSDNLLIGYERGITSDVWAVGIPQLLSQIKNGIPMFNTDMMSENGNMVLSGLPGMGITFFGQPHYWGCLFGDTIGLCWLYWFKKFALLLTSYEVIALLVKNKRLAFLGSAVMVTAPQFQMWFGHTVMTAPIYMQWCIACIAYFLNNHNDLKKKIIACFFGAMGVIGFVFAWYPGLQVPLGYLTIILVIALLVDFFRKKNKLRLNDFVLIGITALFVAGSLLWFLYVSKDSILALMNTAFPGKRVSVGGEHTLESAMYYFFQGFTFINAPKVQNQCEITSILPFMPAVFIITPYVIFKKKDIKMAVVYLYEMFLVSWNFVTYPAWFAKITMMSNVTTFGDRCLWSVALISVYLGFYVLDYFYRHKPSKIYSGVSLAVVAAVTCGLVYTQYNDNLSYFLEFRERFFGYGKYIAVAVIAVFLIFNALYLFGKRSASVMLAVMCFVFGVIGTPLEKGLGNYGDTELTKAIEKIDSGDNDAYWMSGDSFVLSNYVLSTGVKTFNTTNQYMDKQKWSVLDPTGEYEYNYNRYAQINTVFTKDDFSINLKLGDLIELHLTTKELEKLGIDYIVTTVRMEQFTDQTAQFECVFKDSIDMYRIYSVSYN